MKYSGASGRGIKTRFMKDIEVQCIVFTDDCFKEPRSTISILSSLLTILEGKAIIIVFIQDTENFISEIFLNSFDFKNKNCQVVYCKNHNKVWHVRKSSEKSLLIEEDLPIEEVVEFVQIRYSISSASTITVGATQNRFVLKTRSVLHFHVGEKTQLSSKVRGLIPLTEQYEVGLLNIATYFSHIGFKDEAINYHDLLDFVYSSKEFFSSKRAASEIMQKHRVVTQCLKEKFQDDIIAIFGTGFPFYLSETGKILDSVRTPNSILEYFKIQASYFTRKILKDEFYEKNKNRIFTIHELEKIQIFPGRNKFDIYKYEMMGYSPPELEEAEQRSLKDYYSNNCFDLLSDIWPCYYCSTLQNNDLFPNQREIKNTNVTCLSCRQTSFMLRNIMGCSADLDMVVVVNKDKYEAAEKIKKYIYKESPFHFYDTSYHKIFKNNDGPLDLFITQKSDIIRSFENLLLNDWVNSTFDSVALWPPNIPYNFHLGLDFALAFEPIYLNDIQLQHSFSHIRKQFVKKHGIENIVNKLSKSSFYTEQLLSNEDVVEILTNKLKKWNC